MKIVPAILVNNYDDLAIQIKKVEQFFDYAQVDIMDGIFVDNKSFNHNDDRDMADFFNNELKTKLQFELHLMVKNPLNEIERWKNVKNVTRIIFHIESENDPLQVISKIKGNCWQAGIALNPETKIDPVIPYLEQINILQFMTVTPGRQGNPFIPQVKEKIANLKIKPQISIDGGVTLDNIKEIKSWGIDIANIGHALVMQKDIKETYNKLTNTK